MSNTSNKERDMEAKISPLPWAEDAYLVGQINSAEGGKVARANDIGLGYHIDPEQVERCANAAFIVRACNSHDQLVEALREALAVIADYICYEHDGDPWAEDARAMGELDIDDYSRDGRLEKARAALAAAEAP